MSLTVINKQYYKYFNAKGDMLGVPIGDFGKAAVMAMAFNGSGVSSFRSFYVLVNLKFYILEYASKNIKLCVNIYQ